MVGPVDHGWRAHAACRTADPETFFPVAENGPELDRAVATAKRICAGCPVLAECRAWAIEALPHGIAGAMTEHERHHARRTRPPRRVTACSGGASTTRTPVGASRLPRRLRGPVIAAGQAALADGVPRDQVADEFAVTRRTVDRWAATQQRSPPTTGAATGAFAGGDR
ncbi:WhiB family transcriptional regulator [Pseudonocardia sp. HH130629-09]|uniref:WhiB family transcriptional regulator n=1 Tax=Pseudonocardia sp. HH130629-09 TaxID=1641402 RepID=UPI0009E94CB8|nr:WhiB family transcriptional regulator [Pseudonocardia sp. HH130629-09]